MSLLESFGIIFDSNAAELTIDINKLAKKLDGVEKSAHKATKVKRVHT